MCSASSRGRSSGNRRLHFHPVYRVSRQGARPPCRLFLRLLLVYVSPTRGATLVDVYKRQVHDGVQLAIVVGGGNIFRGVSGATDGCLLYTSCMICAHFRRSCTPAKVWMALSMQRCPGIQQPRSALFAALTMASQRRAVMSPRQMLRRGSEAVRASSSASVMPGSATMSWRTRSCTFRNSGEAGFGSRVFTSARNCSHCSMNQRGSSCGSTCLLPAPRSSIR